MVIGLQSIKLIESLLNLPPGKVSQLAGRRLNEVISAESKENTDWSYDQEKYFIYVMTFESWHEARPNALI